VLGFSFKNIQDAILAWRTDVVRENMSWQTPLKCSPEKNLYKHEEAVRQIGGVRSCRGKRNRTTNKGSCR